MRFLRSLPAILSFLVLGAHLLRSGLLLLVLVGAVALRRELGIQFQGSALFDSLSVFDNVAFPLREVGHLGAKAVRARVGETLELLGLTDAAGRVRATSVHQFGENCFDGEGDTCDGAVASGTAGERLADGSEVSSRIPAPSRAARASSWSRNSTGSRL